MLRGDSYQREIEGAVGEGGHEGDSGGGTVWGIECWNGMLKYLAVNNMATPFKE